MKGKYQEIIQKLGGGRVRKDVPLKRHTTFKIGGPADLFCEVKSTTELVKVVNLARKQRVPVFILGGGSNILVADKGFEGLVIKTGGCKGIDVEGETIKAEAGAPTAQVLKKALEAHLSGLEFLSGVPGTIGGAVFTNAHAFFLGDFLEKPKSTADVILEIEILTPKGGIKTVKGDFYPHTVSESAIRKSGDIVLAVTFKLKKRLTRGAKKYLLDYAEFRRDKPYRDYPTAGSIFQNPPGKSAGRLIDMAGLKGWQVGKAQISPKHANFIVNLGGAKATDVLELIKLCQRRVKEKFGIELREEICYVGKF